MLGFFINLDLFPSIAFITFLLLIQFGIFKYIERTWKLNTTSNPAILSAMQIALFIFIYLCAFKLISNFHTPTKGDIGTGIAINLTVWIYSFVSIISSLIVSFLNKKTGFVVLIFSTLIFSILPLSIINFRPYRFSLILMCGILGLFIPHLLQINKKADYIQI